MRAVAGVLLLLCISLSDASVLVRFINTVPTSTTVTSISSFTTNYNPVTTTGFAPLTDNDKWHCPDVAGFCDTNGRAGWPARYQPSALRQKYLQDTVGLYYYAEAPDSPLADATVVYTEPTASLFNRLGSNPSDQMAWLNSMPALRAYHRPLAASAEAAAVDRNVNQEHQNAPSVPYKTGVADYYTPDTLKADGVGLYMSFAPGTYKFEAYGILHTAVLANAAFNNHGIKPIAFTQSATKLTFEDDKVYTIVASGTGSWTDAPSTKGDVSLFLIEESTAPTEFGKSAIRFYHAVGNRKADNLDIYQTDTAGDSSILHSGLAYGLGTTPYFQVAPRQSSIFPIAFGGGSSSSTSTGNTGLTFHLNAGSRATAICAVNAEDRSSEVFCRMIPSRIVSYVRLVADTAGFDGLVLGKLGPQKLSQTPLTLWGSYEYPYPHQAHQGSRDMGPNRMSQPALSTGLYPVVADIKPGTVSGYGEVHVPVFIMDFAVTTRMTPSCTDEQVNLNTPPTAQMYRGYYRSVAGATCLNRAHGYLRKTGYRTVNQEAPTDRLSWHEHAPIFKRINLLVKTDGQATISNDCNDNYIQSDIYENAARANAPKNQISSGTLATAVLTDLFMEPGEMYSIMIMPATARENYGHCSGEDFIDAGGNSVGTSRGSDQPDPAVQTGKNYRFAVSRDVSVHELSQGLSNTAVVTFVSMGDRKNWAELDMENSPLYTSTRAAADAAKAYFSAVGYGFDVNTAITEGEGKPRPDQQDFEGTIVFTAASAQTTITINPHETNFRELIPRFRWGSLSNAGVAVAGSSLSTATPRGMCDWEGMAAAEMNTGNDLTVRIAPDGCHRRTDAACAGAVGAVAGALGNSHIGFARPDLPQTIELAAGTYSFTHTKAATNVNPASTNINLQNLVTDACFTTIPSGEITLEAGKRYHYYVMNQFGCMRDTDGTIHQEFANLGALQGQLVEVQAYVPPKGPKREVPGIDGANSNVASLSLLFAALIAVFAALV